MKYKKPLLVLSAGLPRSGSTLLYNLLRLTLIHLLDPEEDLSFGWIEDMRNRPFGDCTLLKLHDHEEDMTSRSDLTVYSYRDIRDVLASQQRMFGTPPSLNLVDHWIAQHNKWIRSAHIKIRYEDFGSERQSQLVEEIAHHLGFVDNVVPHKVIAQLIKLPNTPATSKRYDPETLLHPGHITDGRHGSWRDQLERELVTAIETKHGDWLTCHGYEITC